MKFSMIFTLIRKNIQWQGDNNSFDEVINKWTNYNQMYRHELKENLLMGKSWAGMIFFKKKKKKPWLSIHSFVLNHHQS